MAEPSKQIHIERRGLMLVISSPSGAGKGTLSRNILDTDRDMTLSISVTTRDRRPSEINGVHYHFISQQRFLSLRDGGELLEWAEVHGNYYGTPRAPVEDALASGRDVLFVEVSAIPADDGDRSASKSRSGSTTRRSSSDTVLETFSKSVARELGRSAPKIMRGVLGGLFRGR